GRHRIAPRRVCHRGRTARHGIDRDAIARTLAALARAGVVLRRRYSGTARRIARARPLIAIARTRPQLAVCDVAGRRGPGLVDPGRGGILVRPGSLCRPAAVRAVVAGRTRSVADRYAGAPR